MRAAGYDRNALLAAGFSDSDLEAARKTSIAMGGAGKVIRRQPSANTLAALRESHIEHEEEDEDEGEDQHEEQQP